MGVSRIALAAGVAIVLASCATRPAPAPEPRPVVRPPPRVQPPVPAPPPARQWPDAPLSPGDWSWDPATATAAYGPAGQPSLVVRCDGAGRVTIERRGAAPATAGTLAVRTSTAARTLPARSAPEGLEASLAASDPLLDAILFSRGRFAVEAGVLPVLIVPAWPEPARVVEDCRG
ncbi:MAG: hypothetical protein QOI38_1152 [Sphingomonadales bacterium]|jgi:hypothetical protein|nr:hypothetical protein [Sphingomonadales bacterium]